MVMWHSWWALALAMSTPSLSPCVGSREGNGGGGGGNVLGGGGGENRRSDGAMFGNGWLPNIAIIINQYFNY